MLRLNLLSGHRYASKCPVAMVVLPWSRHTHTGRHCAANNNREYIVSIE